MEAGCTSLDRDLLLDAEWILFAHHHHRLRRRGVRNGLVAIKVRLDRDFDLQPLPLPPPLSNPGQLPLPRLLVEARAAASSSSASNTLSTSSVIAAATSSAGRSGVASDEAAAGRGANGLGATIRSTYRSLGGGKSAVGGTVSSPSSAGRNSISSSSGSEGGIGASDSGAVSGDGAVGKSKSGAGFGLLSAFQSRRHSAAAPIGSSWSGWNPGKRWSARLRTLSASPAANGWCGCARHRWLGRPALR